MPQDDNVQTLRMIFPEISYVGRYPCYCERFEKPGPLFYIVIHLNDCHHWSFELIADFVDKTVKERRLILSLAGRRMHG